MGRGKRPVSRSANKPRIEEEGRCVWNGESYPLFPLLSFVPRVHSNADSSLSLSLSPSLSTGKQKVGRKSFIACLPHRNCCIKRPRAKKPCDRPWSSPVVTSLPRGGARITHVFVPRGVEGRGGGERGNIFFASGRPRENRLLFSLSE